MTVLIDRKHVSQCKFLISFHHFLNYVFINMSIFYTIFYENGSGKKKLVAGMSKVVFKTLSVIYDGAFALK